MLVPNVLERYWKSAPFRQVRIGQKKGDCNSSRLKTKQTNILTLNLSETGGPAGVKSFGGLGGLNQSKPAGLSRQQLNYPPASCRRLGAIAAKLGNFVRLQNQGCSCIVTA
jgi:hypothetical protein